MVYVQKSGQTDNPGRVEHQLVQIIDALLCKIFYFIIYSVDEFKVTG